MKIPLFKIYWDKEDIEAVTKIIKSGENWAIGPKIEEFEKMISGYVETKYALAFNSGTSALHSLMIAFDIKFHDEVIVPSFSFIATANSPLFTEAKPVFSDIEEQTFGLDPEDVEKKITERTKAIMPMHYGGSSCNIEKLKKIAEKYNLILIEDAAEALGAKFKNKKIGSFGNAAMFSFCAPKIITTGEGGIITTNSRKLYEKLKLIRSHGRMETQNYFNSTAYMDYVQLGYNFRISNILAALGISQTKKLDKIINLRIKNSEYLTNELLKIKEITTPVFLKDCFSTYQMYTIRIKKEEKTRDLLKDYLNKKGIMAKTYFSPIHLTNFYKKTFGYKEGDLPVTEKISSEVLTLPMYPSLTKQEMDYIVETINTFFNN